MSEDKKYTKNNIAGTCLMDEILPTIWDSWNSIIITIGTGFKYVLFSGLPGEMIQFDYRIFFKSSVEGW